MPKSIITEAEAEQIADRIIWRRLDSDPRYQHAENAEEQARAEEEIERAVWQWVENNYVIAS